ncbi:copper resistance protein CopC [Streptomyces sp. NPDC050703]|uniref:copper resistance CopC/CopD family protein n=1 Tax=Streptomyces sp. NPDC050703 TaxID=3157218 RepID=UPI003422821D
METIAPRSRGNAALWRLVLVLIAATGAFLAGAAPVSAHAALTGSDPKQGAVVDKAPAQVKLTFSEKVAMSDGSVRVLDPAGKRVDTEKMTDLGANTYGVKLRPGLPDGTFTVAYQVVSADSHPIAGAFTFSIGAPSDTKAVLPDQAAGGGLVGVLYDIARYFSYAGFILVVGGAAFVLGCWPRGAGVRPVQRLVTYGWVTLTASTLALLLLRAPYTGSGKLADVFDMGALGDVLNTKTGAALVSRLLLLAAAALFIAVLFGAYAKREGPEDAAEKKDLTFGLAIGGAVVAIGIAATWAMAEHASTGIQAGIAMPVDVLHLLAVAAWLGGLAALVVALYRTSSVEASAVRRFSRVAFTSVVVLAATGLYQSWRQVGSWSALTGTRYGQLLLVKIGLVVVLVGVAAVSRRWTGRITAEADGTATKAAEGSRSAVTVAAGARGGAGDVEGAGSAAAGGSGGSGGSGGTGGSGDVEGAKGSGGAGGSQGAGGSGGHGHSGGPGGSGGAGGSAERSAQLARQRAAMATAREKRVRDADPHRTGLRRSVLTEAGVAIALLAVTTVLTTTEPGRTEEEAAKATSAAAAQRSGPLVIKVPFDTGAEDGKGTVQLDLDPGRVGGNDLHVYVKRPNGSAFDVPEVKVSFTLKAKDVGPLPVAPDRIATGHWTASGVQIPMAGDWEIKVTVRTSDIDQVTVDKNAQIG